MIKIDRSHPSFVAKAVGILTGTLTPSPDGRSGLITTRDGNKIPATLHNRAITTLQHDPSLFASELDLLVWPRTCPYDLEVIIVNLDVAATTNPDRDVFLIQGMALRSTTHSKIVKIGIQNNSSDRKNTSTFEKFWLSLHGHLTDGLIRTVYQIETVRKGNRLFIIKSVPHIRQGKRWKLTSTPTRNAPSRSR